MSSILTVEEVDKAEQITKFLDGLGERSTLLLIGEDEDEEKK